MEEEDARWVYVERSVIVNHWISAKFLGQEDGVVRRQDYAIRLVAIQRGEVRVSPWSYDASVSMPACIIFRCRRSAGSFVMKKIKQNMHSDPTDPIAH